jgi:hypothetical protein
VTDPDDPSVVVGFSADAFRLKNGEESLSASWADFFEGEPDQVKAAIDHFKSIYGVKGSDRFAVGNVAAIKAACSMFGLSVRIVREPMPDYDSHAAVRRYRDDNLEMLEALASGAWAQMSAP